jgi:hypothetical protein
MEPALAVLVVRVFPLAVLVGNLFAPSVLVGWLIAFVVLVGVVWGPSSVPIGFLRLLEARDRRYAR